MVLCDNSTLSEAEAALYDRQIRLWGLDAQKRLRSANVLVAGACGLGAEIIKNLVLAGVNSLKISDHRITSQEDTYSNFLAPQESIGQNIAVSSLQRAQNLNPMVNVTADQISIQDLKENYLTQFTIVCICGGTREDIIRLNNICRDHEILFFCGEVYGMHGFMFADLLDHSFVEEVKEKAETKEENKQVTEEMKMVKKTDSFIPFSVAIEIDWSASKYKNRLKRITPSVFILNVLHEFIFLHKRRPNPSQREADEIELLTIKNTLFDKMEIPQEKLPNDFVKLIFGELSPVCAIVGGVLAQDIIKALSKKDPPLNNFFFFHPDEGAGVVEALGY